MDGEKSWETDFRKTVSELVKTIREIEKIIWEKNQKISQIIFMMSDRIVTERYVVDFSCNVLASEALRD